MNNKIINYPKNLIGLDGFKTKILCQKIEKIVTDNKIGFGFNGDVLIFSIHDLNINIFICCDDIYDFVCETEYDYSQLLNKYIDKAGRQIANTSNLTNCIYNFNEVAYLDEPHAFEYHFMYWDLITTTRDPKFTNQIAKDSI